MKRLINIDHMKVLRLGDQLTAASQQVANKTLVARDDLTLCLMSVAAGEEIQTHQAPSDALVQILKGQALIQVGDQPFVVNQGEALVMPAGIPHGLKTEQGFTMLLTLVKGRDGDE